MLLQTPFVLERFQKSLCALIWVLGMKVLSNLVRWDAVIMRGLLSQALIDSRLLSYYRII